MLRLNDSMTFDYLLIVLIQKDGYFHPILFLIIPDTDCLTLLTI